MRTVCTMSNCFSHMNKECTITKRIHSASLATRELHCRDKCSHWNADFVRVIGEGRLQLYKFLPFKEFRNFRACVVILSVEEQRHTHTFAKHPVQRKTAD